jgi:tetratricopeptide (TPR) repeat protein
VKKLLQRSALALIAACCCLTLARADKVKLAAGTQSAGKLTEITPSELTLEIGSTKKKIPVNQVESVQFDGEPTELTQARAAVHLGRYDEAVPLLAKIDASKITRSEIAKDVEFFKALAAARLALAGSGSKAEAGKKLFAFEKAERTSFHYFETCQMLGDLLVALDKFSDAETFYNKLSEAPWPDYKMRSGVLVGRALVGQKQFDRANAKFDEVLAIEGSGPEADRQKLAARLGKATALAAAGKTDDAIKFVEEIIAQADAENLELQARAHIVLGNSYKAAGRKKEALYAFLLVDLLYSRFGELHAEALANLATLWADVENADRAKQARNLLKEKYPSSVWATN